MLDSTMKDITVALRGLARTPGFTLVAVVTLTVAIGATTAIFAVVDGVLLRPLPFPEPNRLVTVHLDASGVGIPELPLSDRGYWHFRDKNRSFEVFGAHGSQQLALTGSGEPTQVFVGMMNNAAFDALGASPLRGRLPTAAEDSPDGPLVVLLGHALWASRFGSDPRILGTTLQIDDQTRAVIGVMPPDFRFPHAEVDLWIPLQLDRESENFTGHGRQIIARLRDDATLQSATTDAESLIQRFEEVGYGPEWLVDVFTGRAIVQTLKDDMVGDSRGALLIILGTMGFVLLVACSNVASLLLVRTEGRSRETAVRLALGAGRLGIIRYALIESSLLAIVGGLGGLALAYSGVETLVAVRPADIPRLDDIGIGANVLLFALAMACVAGLLVGLLPALSGGSQRIQTALSDGGRGSTTGRERHRARRFLVVVEVALALVILVGAGLMVRSFSALHSIDPGFETDGIVTFGVRLPDARYPDADATTQFFDALMSGLRALPAVENAGATTLLPLNGSGFRVPTVIEDFPRGPDDFALTFLVRWVTPGYFETMGIPVLEGRSVEPRDHLDRLGQIFISASLKQRYWPNTSTMGKRLEVGGTWGEVAGVVGDVRDVGPHEPPEPMIYMPQRDTMDWAMNAMTVAVRTNGDAIALLPSIRRVVAELDGTLPLSDVETMADKLGDSMSRTSFTMALLLVAALVSLFLGSIGIYGVISYVVSQRASELGLRMALGADTRTIRWLVLRQGLGLTLVGLLIGLASSLFVTRALTSLLYGVSPHDGLTFIGGPAVFLVVALVACVAPARRAGRLPPADSLRGI